MKKIFPLAVIGAAVGAAAYFVNEHNRKHVERTIETLDEISAQAETTVQEFADELDHDKEA